MAISELCSNFRDLLFRSNPVPMFLYDGPSLLILRANDTALAKYGYTSKEFRTMSIRDLCPSGTASESDAVPPAGDRSSSQCLQIHATKGGKHFTVECRTVQFPDKRRKLFMLSAVEAPEQSGERLKLINCMEINRSLVEECPFGIARFNLTTSRHEHANPALLEMLGCTLKEFRRMGLAAFGVDPTERERFMVELRRSGKVRDFESSLRNKNGEILRVSISGYLGTNVATGHEYVQAYILDVTAQRNLEEQLSRAQRMEAVGRLAGGVAHDFNNITQSISLCCELALSHELPLETRSKFLDIMQQSARAADITRQLLAFSRRQVLQPRLININVCLRNALPMLSRVVGPDVSLELQLDDTVESIFIDPDQLTIVLMHLATNARSAMPHGGGLRISTSHSGDSGQNEDMRPGPCAVLTVSDTGVGMDEQTLQRIFEPFFTTRESAFTSGLGLATVHGIIAQSKGRIECQSTLGHGATFRIYLPTGALPSVPALTAGNNSHRILLAEDDPHINEHLTNSIKKAGFLLDSVCNGDKALAIFDRQRHHLLVTDIVMPKLGGIELMKRLRRKAPSLPVIFISGYSEEASALQHVSHNQTAYLQKPFPSSQLITAISNLLAQKIETTADD